MKKERSYDSGFSAIGVTAVISVLVLVAATGWEIVNMVRAKNVQTSYIASDAKSGVGASAATTDENVAAPLSSSSASPAAGGASESALGTSILEGLVSKYTTLKNQGLYTPEIGQKVAEQMAATLKAPVSYKIYTSSDVQTDPDTSKKRILAYQGDLKTSLAPLLKNMVPEFEIFASYVETKDESYLEKLKDAAKNYRDAANATALVKTPRDALIYHVALLNALQQFAATLDALSDNATDPFASVALLRTYNQAEGDLQAAFTAFGTYYEKQKLL